ncbi:MAG: carboxypeptidase regulatory-like domain-containing protein [Candidatus Thermoplasmatota archaeon]
MRIVSALTPIKKLVAKLTNFNFSVFLLILGIILVAIFIALHKLTVPFGYENYAFTSLGIGLFLMIIFVFKLRAKISDRAFSSMLFAGVALALAVPCLSLSLRELLGGRGSYGIAQYFLFGIAALLTALGLFGTYDRKPLMLCFIGALVGSFILLRYTAPDSLIRFLPQAISVILFLIIYLLYTKKPLILALLGAHLSIALGALIPSEWWPRHLLALKHFLWDTIVYVPIVAVVVFYVIFWCLFPPDKLTNKTAQSGSIALIGFLGLVLPLHELLLTRSIWSVAFFILILSSIPLLLFSLLLLHKPELRWVKENYFVAGVMIFLVLNAFFVRAYFNFEPSTARGFSWVGTDPYYYGRIVDHIVTEKSHLTRDEVINYPSLGMNPRPPLFGWFASALGLLLTPLFNGDSYTSALWALSIAPALWGALTIIPIYYLAKELFNSRKVGLFAAFLIAVMPDHIQGTGFGLSDHDPFYLFFIVLAFFFLVKALKSLNEKRWVASWKKPKDIKLGLKECVRNNKTAIGYSALAGFSILTVVLTWEGFVYLFAILSIYYLVQLAINHIRHEDSLALSLVMLIVVAIPAILSPLSTPYSMGITITDILKGILPWIWYFLIAFLGLSILFVTTRDLPWVIFLPSLIVVGAAGYFALQHFLPELTFKLLGGMGYIIKTKVYGTIGEAQATDLNRCVFAYGIITFYLTLVALFILITQYIKSWKKDKLLICVWSATAIWMTLSAVRFMFNAVPIYAILPAWLIYEIIKKLDFKTMHKNVYAMRYEKLRALRKGMKLRHVAGALFVAFCIILPNIWGAIDAGIPFEEKVKRDPTTGEWYGYDKMIYDWLPLWLKKESYGGLQYLGTHGQSYLAGYWFDGLKWLSTQDKDLAIEKRPAFIAWWDYGFQCVQDGKHPTIADNFQNGIPPAGNFITAQNETRAIVIFITRILHAQYSREGKLSDKVKATLGKYLGEENATELENIITNPDAYLSKVLDNFDKCHKRTSDIADRQSNVGLHRENTMYAGAVVFFAQFDEEIVVKLLHELEDVTGYSVRYFAADQRMFPFNWANTGIYYAPTVLSDQDVSDFFEVLVRGEVLDDEGNSVPGSQTGWMSGEEFSKWRETTLEGQPRGYSVRVIDYRLSYKEPFFKSMFYRAYIGYSGLDIGQNIDTFGIPGISPDVSGREDWLAYQQRLPPMPGWMQRHFRLVYFNAGLRIMKYYEGANLTGHVLTEENYPVSNAHVTVTDELGIPHDRVLTDENGYFKLVAPFGMPENNCMVTVVVGIGELDELGERIMQMSNSQLNRTTVKITYEEAREMKNIELNFTVKSCSLSGKVVWADDNSTISNCTVILRKGDKNFTNISAQDGSYEFKGLPQGSYKIFVNLSSTLRELDLGESLELSMPEKSETKELRVKPCSVNYTVYYVNTTFANASCSLYDLTNNTYYNWTAVNGSFRVGKLLPGNYEITIYQSCYLKFEESFKLSNGDVRNKNVTLYSSSKINGSVYRAENRPTAHVVIRLKNLETNKIEKIVTNESGFYEAELRCGNYSIDLLHTEENVTWIYHKDLVIFNESYTSYDIYLHQAAKLYGKVFFKLNESLSNASSKITFRSENYNLTITSNSSGYYEAYLLSGNYTVDISYPYNESVFVYCEALNLPGGEYLNRDLELVEGVRVYGIVHYDTDEIKDKPIGNLLLRFNSENGSLAVTQSENYTIYLVGNRTYNLEFDFSESDFKEEWFNLTLFDRTLYVNETKNESTNKLEPLEYNIFLKPNNASFNLNITCKELTTNLSITVFLNATDDVAVSTNVTLNITSEWMNYSFLQGLNPGNYLIVVDYNGTENGAQIRYLYNKSFNIELGTNASHHNITLEKEFRVNGTVWVDLNNNGTLDENETLSNISIQLKFINGTGSPIPSILSKENGSYEVWLKPGNYSIFAEYLVENITHQNENATYQNITYLCLDYINVSKDCYKKDIILLKALKVNGTVYWENETVKEEITLTFLHIISNITRSATAHNGNYTILLLPGEYLVTVNYTTEKGFGNLTYTCSQLLKILQPNISYNISVTRDVVIKLWGIVKYNDTAFVEHTLGGVSVCTTNITSNITYNTTTDEAGRYQIYLPPGEYNITFKRAGFEPIFITLFNASTENYTQNVYLNITNITLLGFTYYDENMNNVFESGDFVIPNVEIEFIGKELKVRSNITGFYNSSLPFGTYNIYVSYATAWGDAYGAFDKFEITPYNITSEGKYLRNISMTRCFRVYGITYYYNLTGIYKRASQNNISKILNISVNGLINITADADGSYQIILPRGRHSFSANFTTFEYDTDVTYTCYEELDVIRALEFNLNFTVPANATLDWNESEYATIGRNETVQYNITITNTGNLEDTFKLDPRAPPNWRVECNITNVTLAPRSFSTFTVNITSSVRATAGNNTVTITATSTRDATKQFSVETFINITQVYGFNMSCAEFEKGIGWNYTINYTTYSITILNEGNGEDTVNLSWENLPAGWNASLDVRLVTIKGPDDTKVVKLTVTAPPGALRGERADIIVVGRSYWENGTVRNSSSVNITAIISLPDLAIKAIELSKPQPAPNETVFVNITVENIGLVDAEIIEGFELKFYVNEALNNTTSIDKLSAKQNITFSFSWPTPTTSGWYNLRAVIAPRNETLEFEELNKANNALAIKVLVGEERAYWKVIAFVLGIAVFIIALAMWRRIRRRR